MLYSLCTRAVGGMEKGYLDWGLSNWRATGRMMRSILKSRRERERERGEKKGNIEKVLLGVRGARGWGIGDAFKREQFNSPSGGEYRCLELVNQW